jgi:hypothetical protein
MLLLHYDEQLFLPDHTVDAAIFCILFKKQISCVKITPLSQKTREFYSSCLAEFGGEDLVKPIKRSLKYHRYSRYKRTKDFSRKWEEKAGELIYWYCMNLRIRTPAIKNLPYVNLDLP